MRDKAYAEKRVVRLKAKLEHLLPQYGPEVQKQINSTKWALRRWLRAYPDIDPEFLTSITRD
tara:strand:- start:368 stop:553 length:186 start_codon:yes stop_codon:yes gene_type:complete